MVRVCEQLLQLFLAVLPALTEALVSPDTTSAVSSVTAPPSERASAHSSVLARSREELGSAFTPASLLAPLWPPGGRLQ